MPVPPRLWYTLSLVIVSHLLLVRALPPPTDLCSKALPPSCYILKSAHFLVFPKNPNFSHLQTDFLRNYYWKDVNIPWISGQYYLRCYLFSAEAESILGHGAITILPG